MNENAPINLDKYASLSLENGDKMNSSMILKLVVLFVYYCFYGIFGYFVLADWKTLLFTSDYLANYVLYMAIIISIVSIVAFIWVLFMGLSSYQCLPLSSKQAAADQRISYEVYFTQKWDNILSVLCTIFSGLFLVHSAITRRQCDTSNHAFTDMWRCDNGESIHVLRQELLMLTCMTPILFAVVYRVSVEAQILNWVLSIAAVAFSIIAREMYYSFVYLGLFVLFSFGILHANHVQSMYLAKLAIKHKTLLATEFQRTMVVTQAFEIRLMVNALALEMKSHLASLSTGIEIMRSENAKPHHISVVHPFTSETDIFGAAMSSLSNKETTTIPPSSSSQLVAQASSIVAGNCALLALTLDQMLDYSKLSRGLKIVPQIVSVDILGVLKFCVTVGSAVQSKSLVRLKKFDRNIKSQLQTDERWFRDGLLHLVLNAVKFSQPGSTVVISVSIVETALLASSSSSAVSRFTKKPISQTSTVAATKKILATSLTPHARLEAFLDRNTAPKYQKSFDLKYVPAMNFDYRHAAMEKMLAKEEAKDSSISNGNYDDVEEDIESVMSLEEKKTIDPHMFLSKYIKFEVTDFGTDEQWEQPRAVSLESFFDPTAQANRLAEGRGMGLYLLAHRVQALGGKYGVRAAAADAGEEAVDAEVPSRRGCSVWFSLPYVNIGDDAEVGGQGVNALTSVSVDNDANRVRTEKIANFPASYSQSPVFTSKRVTFESAQHQKSSLTTNIEPSKEATMPNLEIIVVDSSLTSLKLISMLLSNVGHVVTSIEQGNQAIKTMIDRQNDDHQVPFEVLLVDLNVIGGGLNVIKRMRSRETTWEEATEITVGEPDMTNELCIIAMAAMYDETTEKQALAAGADYFIKKPFRIEDFNNSWQSNVKNKTNAMIQEGKVRINGRIVTDPAAAKAIKGRGAIVFDNIKLDR